MLPDVLLVRKGHALEARSVRARPDSRGRTQKKSAARSNHRGLCRTANLSPAQPYKSMVFLAVCTRLRISEVLGLRGPLADFERLIMATKGYVRSQQPTKLKSGPNQRPYERFSSSGELTLAVEVYTVANRRPSDLCSERFRK